MLKLTTQLTTIKKCLPALLITTACILGYAYAETQKSMDSDDIKKEDATERRVDAAEDQVAAEVAVEQLREDETKIKIDDDLGGEYVPSFSSNEMNVLDVPDSAVDDFSAISRRIFKTKNQGYTSTIDEAMTSAYDTNPDIKAKRAELRSTDENLPQAIAGWKPQIQGKLSSELNEQRQINGERIPGQGTTGATGKNGIQRATIELQQNLFKGGNTVYQTRQAEASIKSRRWGLRDQVQKTLYESIQAYINLLSKYAELQYFLDNEDISKKGLEQNIEKAKVGDETRTTVAQSEFNYTDAVGSRIRAEGEVEALKAAYEKVVNKKPGNLLVPKIPNLPNSLEEVLERARLNNPQIHAAQYSELEARHNVDVNQSALLPSLDLTASSSAYVNRNKNNSLNTGPNPNNRRYFRDKTVNNSVNLALTVPFDTTGTTRSRTRQAAEVATQRRVDVERTRREVLEKASRAWSGYVYAKENRVTYMNKMKAAQASVDGVRQEVEVGAKAYIDFINETQRLIQAQRDYVLSEQTYYLSAYELLYWMGELSPQSQHLPVEIYDPKIHYNDVKYKF